MSKSILQGQHDNICFLCGANGTTDPLEEHHIFGGSNRKHSERYGLKVKLCGNKCHRNGPNSVHKNIVVNRTIQALGQVAFERTHTREDFMKIFGRNYL